MVLGATATVDTMVESGFGPFVGVPCSALKPFINRVISTPGLAYVPSTNEGESIALAAGMWLAGKMPVVMFQNSGLGNTVNALSSLNAVFDIPSLLVVTWRGAPELNDAPQHRVMGNITADLLASLEVENSLFPDAQDDVLPSMEMALNKMNDTRRPYAFIMKKGTVEPYELKGSVEQPPLGVGRRIGELCDAAPSLLRLEMIEAMAGLVSDDTPIVSTTGKTSRELFNVKDRDLNFYMVGSMGSASSLGLGLTLAGVESVVVLDGDGAMLMRMEALASIGWQRPPGFIHVVLDNSAYESTGNQPSISPAIDFEGVALACGYATATTVVSADDMAREYARCTAEPGPHLIRAKILSGSDPNLGRPTVTPPEIATRFKSAVLKTMNG